MNHSTAVFLINPNVRAITVSYEPDPAKPNEPKAGQVFIFKTFDKTIRPKELVVIPTDTRWNMTIGRVEDVDVEVDFESQIQIKWLVGRVDKDEFTSSVAQENDMLSAIRSAEVRKKREDLAKALLADNAALRNLPIANASGSSLPPLAPPESPYAPAAESDEQPF